MRPLQSNERRLGGRCFGKMSRRVSGPKQSPRRRAPDERRAESCARGIRRHVHDGAGDCFGLKEGTRPAYTIQMDTVTHQQIEDACCDLADEQIDLVREVMTRISGKWTGWILSELDAEGGPLRFSRLLERVHGITQKMLTQCLRQLESDGFVVRTLYPQVPPRVEYELTPLGRDVLEAARPLWYWMVVNAERLEAARRGAAVAAQPPAQAGAGNGLGASPP